MTTRREKRERNYAERSELANLLRLYDDHMITRDRYLDRVEEMLGGKELLSLPRK